MYKRIQNIPSSYFIFLVLACMVGLMLKYHVVQWAVAFLFDFLISVRAFLASMDGWDYLLGLMGISGLVGVVVKFRLPRLSFWVLLALLSSAMLSSVASWFITSPSGRSAEWWTSWLQNFSTEMFGAITTFILFELIIGGNEKEQARLADEKASKDDMIRRLRSEDSTIVKIALDEAREKSWLYDGTLMKINLVTMPHLKDCDLSSSNLSYSYMVGMNLLSIQLKNANLESVELEMAKLEMADLSNAYLVRANLRFANLRNANLQGTNFQDAILIQSNIEGSNLQNAIFSNADLSGAVLKNANLSWSYLWGANLTFSDMEGANLSYVNQPALINMFFSQVADDRYKGINMLDANLLYANLEGADLTNATLPDGTKWTPETDMERFTNPNHPDFWEPQWVKNWRTLEIALHFL